MTECERLKRSVCTLTERLEALSSQNEHLCRQNEKLLTLLKLAGSKMEHYWGSKRNLLPDWILEVIDEAKRLEASHEDSDILHK